MNILWDICLQAHRSEKIARASSAAIMVEQKAAQLEASKSEEPVGSTTEAEKKSQVVRTEAAFKENGEVFLTIDNPLKTVKEIRCPKCHLPRLLYPTDGIGARKPEPGVEYCKNKPFIDKPYFDIYGQTFVPEGPGRGKKKKDMINPLKQAQAAKEGTPSGSQDSPGGSPPAGEGPVKPIPFPHAKCHNCNNFLPIKRMNNHMAKCIGGNGRESSRNALTKIQNGNGNGTNGHTPSTSRKSTPVPSSQPNSRTSPNKRDAAEDLDSDTPQKKKKVLSKKLKTHKLGRIGTGGTGVGMERGSSNLSFEKRLSPGDEDGEEAGEDDSGEYGAIKVEPRKKLKPVGKKKDGDLRREKKSSEAIVTDHSRHV